MKKNGITLLLLFGFFVNGIGQKGNEFWFAAPDLQKQHGDSPIFLRLSAFDYDADITISLPADPSFLPIKINIPRNESYNLNLTEFKEKIENNISNTRLKKGLLIKSSCEISAYYDIANVFNGDLFSLKGENGLGLKFTIPFQMDFRGRDYPEYKKSVIILSTEDNNSIKIVSPKDLSGLKANKEFEIVLNRGETYLIENIGSSPKSGPGGTVVISEKPITITVNDDSILLPGYGCSDSAGDQLIPDDLAGNTFVLNKGYLHSDDAYYVFAIEDSTEIFIEGYFISSINKGEYYSGRLNKNSVYIKTSKPSHVFHISGFGCELGGAIIPAMGCTGSKSVNVTRATNQDFFINIVCQKDFISGFTFNNKVDIISASDFELIEGSQEEWMSARISIPVSLLLPQATAKISNKLGVFHLGVIHGNKTSTTRFGYFSDFSSSKIELNSALVDDCFNFQDLCFGSEVDINAEGEGLTGFYWVNNKNEVIKGSKLFIDSFSLDDRGFYTVYANNDGVCESNKKKIFLRGNENIIDSLKIDIEVLAICENDNSINLSPSIFSEGNNESSSYLWDVNGDSFSDSTISEYSFDSAGIFSVELKLTDQFGCISTAKDLIEILPSPSFNVEVENNYYCAGDSTEIKIQKEEFNNDSYYWYRNGVFFLNDTIKSLILKEDGEYLIRAKNEVGCENSSGKIIITELPKQNEYINETICFGESLNNYKKSGIYIDTFINSFGCDSIIQIDLTVRPPSGTSLNFQFCESSELYYDGNRIFETGAYNYYFLDQYGCDSIVTVNAKKIEEDFLGNDTTICGNSTFQVTSPFENSIWSNGTVASTITIDKNQLISAKVNGFDNCYIEDSIYIEFSGNVYLPNAFSPNNDGINDCYGVFTNFDKLKNFEFLVYDRWGEQLFKTQNFNECWDGFIDGTIGPSGIYLYVVKYEYEDCPMDIRYGEFLLVN